ncbi:MAG TPA: carbohydrate-binding family 9-like protein [Terriglobia bacterium]|nr:carbohydrate-binding family 9-like protein [Terriglobia bacterium]
MSVTVLVAIILLASVLGPPPSPGERRQDRSSPYTSDAQITARFCRRDFVPDGDLNKSAWKRAQWVEFAHDMSGRQSYPGAATRVAVLWSGRYLYIGFSCQYDHLNIYEGEDPAKERWELWNRDVAEVFINAQPERVSHYYEFEVAPNNQWIDLEIDKTRVPFNDAGWNSGFTHATRIGRIGERGASGKPASNIWTCEMRIPVAALGVTAMPPEHDWRINFFRADGSGGDAQRRFLAWSAIPEGNTFHVPTRFGRLHFGK